jgi:hypothetical protein
MADLLYTPPRQMIKECQFLEKNYLNCLLQKGLKDKTLNNECNLEQVLYFHTECPDYIKKYDDPVEGPAFLKKQMFNLLAYPYFNHRQAQKEAQSNKSQIQNVIKSGKYLEYPEMNSKINAAGPEFSLLVDSKL